MSLNIFFLIIWSNFYTIVQLQVNSFVHSQMYDKNSKISFLNTLFAIRAENQLDPIRAEIHRLIWEVHILLEYK